MSYNWLKLEAFAGYERVRLVEQLALVVRVHADASIVVQCIPQSLIYVHAGHGCLLFTAITSISTVAMCL